MPNRKIKSTLMVAGVAAGAAAAVTLLAGAGLALGSPGFAQAGAASPPAATPSEPEARPERREERIIIRTRRDGEEGQREHAQSGDHGDRERRVVIVTEDGDHAAHGDREVRSFTLHRGDGDHAAHGDADEIGRAHV